MRYDQTLQRFKITWFGRQLALIFAKDGEAAKTQLLAERGYGYLTLDVLEAEPLEVFA